MAPANNSKRKSPEPVEASSSKRAKLSPDFSNPAEMVTILVGEEGKAESFAVHKEFACHHSPVWKAAFNSSFVEGQDQTYRLDDMSPNAFRLLVKWLYSQRLDDPQQLAKCSIKLHREDLGGSKTTLSEVADMLTVSYLETKYAAAPRIIHELHLIQLWILADRLLIRTLQNAVVDSLDIFWHNKGPPRFPLWMHYMYKNTSRDSRLRHMVVDRFAYNFPAAGFYFTGMPNAFPQEMLIEMAVVLAKNTGSSEDGSMLLFHENRWRDYYVPEDE